MSFFPPPGYMPGNPGAPVPLPPSRFPFWGGSQGPISYLQAAAPTNIPPGTLWIDSASGSGRTYRWNGLGFDDTGIGQLPSGFLTGVTGTVNQVVASANVGGVVTLSLAPDVSGINSLTTAAGLFSNGATLTRADGGYQLELASASRTYGFAISGTTFLLDDLTGGTRLSFTSAGILGLGAPYQAVTGILTNAVSTGAVTSATIGSSLSLSGGALNTIQDLRTTASPTFAGLTVTTPTFAGWTFNAGPSPAFIQAPSGAQIQDNGGQINIVANHANQGVSLVTQMGGAVNLSIAGTPGLTVSSARLIALPAYTTAGPLTNDASGNVSSIASGGNGTFLGVSGGVLGFFTPAGSGTINSGTSGQLTYYAATGTAVSGAAGTSITGQGSLVLSNSTNTSLASLSVQNNQQAALTLDSFGSTASGTIAGFNKAGAVALIAGPGGATSPTALVIETFNNQPVIFGVNDIEVGRFISTTFALPSTLTGGLQVHNQVDEVTNYERLEALWSTNVAIIRTAQGGTGSNRSLQLSTSAGGDAFTIATGQNGSGVFQFSAVGGSFATASALGIVSGTAWTQASGQQNFVTIRPTYNQSASTAANTDLLINRTQTSVGSGTQRLTSWQVNGSEVAYVDNSGSITANGNLKSQNSIVTASAGSAASPIINQNFTTPGGGLYFPSSIQLGLTAGVTTTAVPALFITNGGSFTGAAATSQIGTQIAYTINQTSTAAFTDFQINRTQTAVGSGAQLLIDAQVSTVSKWKVDNTGLMTTAVNSLVTSAGTMTFPPASAAVGYINVPQNSQSAAYTTVSADQGKHILHPSADTTARVFTIDSNANVALPVGTAITFVNQNAAGVVTISITSDTMRLAGAGTTGSRTLAANGIATALKIATTEWIISGTGLT